VWDPGCGHILTVMPNMRPQPGLLSQRKWCARNVMEIHAELRSHIDHLGARPVKDATRTT